MSDIPESDRTYRFEAIGTTWQIDVDSPLQDQVKDEIARLIDSYDCAFSRFRPESTVSQAQKAAGRYHFMAYADELFQLYARLYELTNGMFTPLVGQILEDLGYDADYSLVRHATPHSPPAWPDVATYSSGELITSQPLVIDVGAAGKGHLVDLVCSYLAASGYQSYCVDAGGDIRTQDLHGKPQRIGLEHPDNTNLVIGTVDVVNQSICASATNRRRWGAQLHHVINPHTAHPTTSISATWVISDRAMVADALATCLFLVDPEVLGAEYDFEFLRIGGDNRLEKSQHFNATLFS